MIIAMHYSLNSVQSFCQIVQKALLTFFTKSTDIFLMCWDQITLAQCSKQNSKCQTIVNMEIFTANILFKKE